MAAGVAREKVFTLIYLDLAWFTLIHRCWPTDLHIFDYRFSIFFSFQWFAIVRVVAPT